jgi:hypothetical protein
MLRSLAHPVTFLGMFVGFLVAIAVHALAQALAARASGDRWAVREARKPAGIVDPFGAIAAIIAGPGWGVTRDPGTGRGTIRGRGRRLAMLLAGPAAALLVGALGIVGYLAAGGPRFLLDFVRMADLLQGLTGPAAQVFLLAFGIEALAVGVLSLVPLPPLTGWRVLMLYAGRSNGWQRARYYLEERNFGVIALLVLLLIPLGFGGPILLELVDHVVGLLLGLAA